MLKIMDFEPLRKSVGKLEYECVQDLNWSRDVSDLWLVATNHVSYRVSKTF